MIFEGRCVRFKDVAVLDRYVHAQDFLAHLRFVRVTQLYADVARFLRADWFEVFHNGLFRLLIPTGDWHPGKYAFDPSWRSTVVSDFKRQVDECCCRNSFVWRGLAYSVYEPDAVLIIGPIDGIREPRALGVNQKLGLVSGDFNLRHRLFMRPCVSPVPNKNCNERDAF